MLQQADVAVSREVPPVRPARASDVVVRLGLGAAAYSRNDLLKIVRPPPGA